MKPFGLRLSWIGTALCRRATSFDSPWPFASSVFGLETSFTSTMAVSFHPNEAPVVAPSGMVIARLRLGDGTQRAPLKRGGQEAIHFYSKPDVQPHHKTRE